MTALLEGWGIFCPICGSPAGVTRTSKAASAIIRERTCELDRRHKFKTAEKVVLEEVPENAQEIGDRVAQAYMDGHSPHDIVDMTGMRMSQVKKILRERTLIT